MAIKPVGGQSHREIIDLLPWYVNGTLLPDEREKVAAHLAGCPDCLAESQMLNVLRSAVEESNARLPFPADGQLDALLSRIEKEGTARPHRGLVARIKDWWGPLPAFARWALVAQAVAVVALACMAVALWRRADRMEAEALRERQRAEALRQRERPGDPAPTPTRDKPGTQYETLSGPQEEVAGLSVKITVVFHEDASAKEIQELLTAVKANIVSGPTLAGVYVLSIAVPPDADPRQVVNEALERLRGRKDLVRLAEPRR